MEKMIDKRVIRETVRGLAGKIRQDYDQRDALTIVSVLDGSFMFTADLVRYLGFVMPIVFVKATSYKGQETTGQVVIQGDRRDVRLEHVLVVEDIVDTGLTAQAILDKLKIYEPKSLQLCTLLSKPSRRLIKLEAKYCGFKIPDKFVVGYGMDYDGLYRNLPDIWTIKPGEVINYAPGVGYGLE